MAIKHGLTAMLPNPGPSMACLYRTVVYQSGMRGVVNDNHHAMYPDNASNIDCVRINGSEVIQGRWSPDVSEDLQEPIREYFPCSGKRAKNYLMPESDLLNISCIQCY